MSLFDSLVFQPLLSLLKFIYEYAAVQDLGLAIIFFTLIIRLVLAPFFYKSAKDQALMKRLQPHIEKIKNKHRSNKEKQAQELMALYKAHKLNPFSSLLILIIQLPIFIALFKVFRNSEFIVQTFANTTLFGIVGLGETSALLSLVTGGMQYLQGKAALGGGDKKGGTQGNPMQRFGKTFVYAAPVLTVIILINLPAALALYWLVSTLFSFGQQLIINRKLAVTTEEINERRSRENKDNN